MEYGSLTPNIPDNRHRSSLGDSCPTINSTSFTDSYNVHPSLKPNRYHVRDTSPVHFTAKLSPSDHLMNHHTTHALQVSHTSMSQQLNLTPNSSTFTQQPSGQLVAPVAAHPNVTGVAVTPGVGQSAGILDSSGSLLPTLSQHKSGSAFQPRIVQPQQYLSSCSNNSPGVMHQSSTNRSILQTQTSSSTQPLPPSSNPVVSIPAPNNNAIGISLTPTNNSLGCGVAAATTGTIEIPNAKPSEALFVRALIGRCKRLAPLWFRCVSSMRERNREENRRAATNCGQSQNDWTAVAERVAV
ncbi:unnamed protein product [Protopolystoma xenopodis]|uniref:Uncharacterized protein n=1 Tax=Protopolystoma xenopodis TaxID=117903 RepID=A0A3S5A1M4_9PLAT|nr:unnamed protein product [Protopolystoma xenopodis]